MGSHSGLRGVCIDSLRLRTIEFTGNYIDHLLQIHLNDFPSSSRVLLHLGILTSIFAFLKELHVSSSLLWFVPFLFLISSCIGWDLPALREYAQL